MDKVKAILVKASDREQEMARRGMDILGPFSKADQKAWMETVWREAQEKRAQALLAADSRLWRQRAVFCAFLVCVCVAAAGYVFYQEHEAQQVRHAENLQPSPRVATICDRYAALSAAARDKWDAQRGSPVCSKDLFDMLNTDDPRLRAAAAPTVAPVATPTPIAPGHAEWLTERGLR